MKRCFLTLALAILSFGMSFTPVLTYAAPRERCFQETGLCVSGAILAYWEKNGGLPVFGYPISSLATETVENWKGPVQWFERDRLEDHGRDGVLAGRLAAEVLERQDRPWQSLPLATTTPDGCRFFAETGHTLCGPFLRYWTDNGGLMRFGFPISEAFRETLPTGNEDTWTGTVQYFERRRMEYHPEHAGTPYDVLLGLLGRMTYVPPGSRGSGGSQYFGKAAPPLEATARAYPTLMSAAAPFAPPKAHIQTQPFERGAIVWVKVDTFSDQAVMYSVYFDSTRNSLVWEAYTDTWTEGQPESDGETPPVGLYAPTRSIGKLWRENQHLRDTLGWATGPALEEQGFLQMFTNSDVLYRASTDRVFIFIKDHRAKDMARIRAGYGNDS